MSQSTFDDDDLFGEAAAETRAEVEEHLAAAREGLPDPDDVWLTDADNVLGALNGLKSALDADDLEAEIAELASLVGDIESAADEVASLTGTIPAIRGALQDAADDDE